MPCLQPTVCTGPEMDGPTCEICTFTARIKQIEELFMRELGGDYLSLQALYVAKLGEIQGHEQDRAKIQSALGNGANEDLWQPGTSWVDAAIRAIQHYENHL